MLLLARRLAHPTSPLYIALRKALSEHDGYGLVICGHSLGAGVGALLGMLWADLSTAETVGEGLALDVGRETSDGRREIGKLPKGRKVKVYAFASPYVPKPFSSERVSRSSWTDGCGCLIPFVLPFSSCITSSALSTLARPLITSVVLSYDLVSRLSLVSIRDLRAVSDWISYGLSDGESGGVDGLIGKLSARKVRSLTGSEGDEDEMDWVGSYIFFRFSSKLMKGKGY
jgi:sn1-specific diacylglycerol lipase